MASGDRYILKLKSTYLSQAMLNVFFYEQTAGTGGANMLADAFDTNVLAALSPMNSNQVSYNAVEVLNLDNPLDFIEFTPTTAAGAQTGDYLPPFVAINFRYARATRAYRHGSKRFSGLTESMVANGGLDAAYIATVTALGNALEAALSNLTGDAWTPKLAHRTVVGGVTTYTLYDFSSVFYTHIGTQNSRKPY